MILKSLSLFLLFSLCSCFSPTCKNSANIEVSELLLIYTESYPTPYCKLLRQSIQRDTSAFLSFLDLQPADAAGYDHGEVILSLFHFLGEEFVLSVTKKLDRVQINRIKSYISVGLEYGWSFNGQKLEDIFPRLYERWYTDEASKKLSIQQDTFLNLNANGLHIGYKVFSYIGELERINQPAKDDLGCLDWILTKQQVDGILSEMQLVEGVVWGAQCYTFPCKYKGQIGDGRDTFNVSINAAAHVILSNADTTLFFIAIDPLPYFSVACDCCE